MLCPLRILGTSGLNSAGLQIVKLRVYLRIRHIHFFTCVVLTTSLQAGNAPRIMWKNSVELASQKQGVDSTLGGDCLFTTSLQSLGHSCPFFFQIVIKRSTLLSSILEGRNFAPLQIPYILYPTESSILGILSSASKERAASKGEAHISVLAVPRSPLGTFRCYMSYCPNSFKGSYVRAYYRGLLQLLLWRLRGILGAEIIAHMHTEKRPHEDHGPYKKGVYYFFPP